MVVRKSRILSLVLAAVFVGALTGCDGSNRTETISEVRTVSPATETAAPMDAAHGGVGMAAAPRSTGLAWDTPEGWTERPSSGMRLADFQVGEADANAECYITRLSGTGGGLAANLNRWRQQVGLEDLTDEEVAALPKLTVLENEGVLALMEGSYVGMGEEPAKEGFGLLGLVVEKGGNTYFVKMTGPVDLVRAQQEAFTNFCTSLRESAEAMPSMAGSGDLPAGHPPLPGATDSAAGALPSGHPPIGGAPDGTAESMPADHPPMGGIGGDVAGLSVPAVFDGAPFTWTAPEGWTDGSERSMRTVTYTFGENGEAECYIIVLGGNAGGVEANLNRWQGQMGQPKLSAEAIEALPRINVLGKPSAMVEISGQYTDMSGVEHGDQMLYGVIREGTNQSLFIKCTGPADVLTPQKDAFIAFCESIK